MLGVRGSSSLCPSSHGSESAILVQSNSPLPIRSPWPPSPWRPGRRRPAVGVVPMATAVRKVAVGATLDIANRITPPAGAGTLEYQKKTGSTATNCTVDAGTGRVTAGDTTGNCVVEARYAATSSKASSEWNEVDTVSVVATLSFSFDSEPAITLKNNENVRANNGNEVKVKDFPIQMTRLMLFPLLGLWCSTVSAIPFRMRVHTTQIKL